MSDATTSLIHELTRLIGTLQPAVDASDDGPHRAAWRRLSALAAELEGGVEAPHSTGRMSGAEFEAIAEQCHASLAYLDAEFTFLYANPTYVAGCGHTREELIGRNHFDLFPNPENEAIFARVRDTGEPAIYRAKPFVYADQPERGVTYWDWTLVPDVDGDGRVRGLVFSLQDVTQQERARAATRRHVERMDALIDVSKQVLAATSREDLLQRVVAAACQLTGARLGASGHGLGDGRFQVEVAYRDGEALACSQDAAFAVERGGVYLDLIHRVASLRLTDAELRRHPNWWGLPEGHHPLNGLLGARLTDVSGHAVGLIMVSAKSDGEFAPEDEAVVIQLATIASLGLQHIEQRAEAQRQADEMSAVFASLADAVVVLDAQGVPVRANPAAATLFGMDIVRGDRSELARRLDVRHPDGRPMRFDELPSSRLLRGERVVDERMAFTAGDGVRRITIVSATPLHIDGTLMGGVAIWHDVTEREALLQRLSLEQSRLRAIIDNAPMGIVVADDAARMILTNPRFVALMQHPEGGAGREPPRLYRDDGSAWPPGEHPLTRSALHGEVHRDVEVTLRWPDGAQRHLLVSSTPIRDAASRLTGGVAAIQDIGGRKRAEMALRRYADEQAALYAVSSAIAAWTEPDRLLNTLLEVVLPLLDADAGWVLLPGRSLASPPRVAAWRGLPDAFIAANETTPLGDCPACAALLNDRRAAHEPQYTANCTRLSREVLAESALHGHIIIPLSAGEQTLGILNVGWRRPHPYPEAERALASAIGHQVGLALYNAQLYQEARQVDRLRVLADLDLELAATLEPTQVRAVALGRLMAALRASTGVLLAAERPETGLPSTEVFADGTSSPWPEGRPDEDGIRDVIARALREREPFLLSSAEVVAALGEEAASDAITRWGVSPLATPVRGSDGSLLLILVGRPRAEHPFGDEDLGLARAAAARIAQASENARLYEAVRRQRQQVRALSSRLTEAEEAERQRIARELHDRIGQDLTALSFNLSIVNTLLPQDTQGAVTTRLGDAMALVERTTKDIRNIMSELRPLVLDDYGLVAGLQWYASEFSHRMGIRVYVEGQEPAPRLGSGVETALFRVAQEALTNVAKHAQASRVTLSIAATERGVRLVVADDGVGFDPANLTGPTGDHGWGLLSMRERVEALGGRCTVEAAPGCGTRIVAEVDR